MKQNPGFVVSTANHRFSEKLMQNKSIILLLISLFLLSAFTLSGQECDCISQFNFVRKYYETNNAAFQKIKNSKRKYEIYLRQAERLLVKINQNRYDENCQLYLNRYIDLLKDHHSGIDPVLKRINIDFNSQRSIDSFKLSSTYGSFRKIKLDTARILPRLRLIDTGDAEGIYINGNSTITIGIIETGKNKYTGVVLKKSKLLDVGHILLEMRKNKTGSFDCIYYTGLLGFNFSKIFTTVQINDGKINKLGLSKVGIPGKSESGLYSFIGIDSVTNYLRLKSFDKALKQELSMFYDSIDKMIQSKPYLIIDLRDNGGGDEETYSPLLKYMYTDPLKVDQVSVWVTPDNLESYEKAGWTIRYINELKNSKPFSFTGRSKNEDGTWTMEGTSYPRKVALIFNRSTASSAEGMITYAIQSNKVITFGENSGGYIGYGNVVTVAVPCDASNKV